MAHEGRVLCSICLESIVESVGRATATLGCDHRFHLDCIGSAFNAGRRMICPNCRFVEQGQWLAPQYPLVNESNENETRRQREGQMLLTYEEASLHYMQHQLEYQQEFIQLLRNLTNTDQVINRMLAIREIGHLVPSGFHGDGALIYRTPTLSDGALHRVSPSRSRNRSTPYDRPSSSTRSNWQASGSTSRGPQLTNPAIGVRESVPITHPSDQVPDVERVPCPHMCPRCLREHDMF